LTDDSYRHYTDSNARQLKEYSFFFQFSFSVSYTHVMWDTNALLKVVFNNTLKTVNWVTDNDWWCKVQKKNLKHHQKL